MFQNKSKAQSHIFRKVALLFIAGLLAIGVLSTYVMYRSSVKDSKEELMAHALATSKDIKGYIEHYPAHEWLLRYWYQHPDTLEVDYEAEQGRDSQTAKKTDYLETKYSDFTTEFAATRDIERLTPEEQKMYAEIFMTSVCLTATGSIWRWRMYPVRVFQPRCI